MGGKGSGPTNEYRKNDGKKHCPKCDETDLSKFAKNKSRPDGLQSYCKKCQYQLKNLKITTYKLQEYHLTPEEYEQKAKKQGDVCAICEKPSKRRLTVDHDHKCCPKSGSCCGKCVRGLLCSLCNSLLGFAGDDLQVLLRAVKYLKKYPKK